MQMRALAKRKGNVSKQPLAISRDDHPDHKAPWPKYGPPILKNSFPGNEINEDTLGESKGNHAFLQLSKMHREP